MPKAGDKRKPNVGKIRWQTHKLDTEAELAAFLKMQVGLRKYPQQAMERLTDDPPPNRVMSANEHFPKGRFQLGFVNVGQSSDGKYTDLNSILVHPEQRGKGYARDMMTSLERGARANAVRTGNHSIMRLQAADKSLADNMYSKMGYKRNARYGTDHMKLYQGLQPIMTKRLLPKNPIQVIGNKAATRGVTKKAAHNVRAAYQKQTPYTVPGYPRKNRVV
jgi:GNAT superfamily N-acetyltransferase